MLAKYAEAVVNVGLNIRAGQRLIIRGALPQFAPLTREIAKSAYKAGAKYVEILFADEEMTRIRIQHAPADSFDEFPVWQVQGMLNLIEEGDAAMLSIAGANPDLLNGLDIEIIGKMQQAQLKNWKPIGEKISSNAVNWCVIAAAGEAWAQKVFPDLPLEEAQAKLWQAIFETTRIDRPDPVAAWNEHIVALHERAARMQAKQYSALHYAAPGTDFTVGLPQGHLWISAQSVAQNGVTFTANMPTEEVFTLPDRFRADGVISATFPLSYGGSLIEDFQIRFENGQITKVSAKKGEAVLEKLIATDEGSRRLGEIALVPASSPIAKRGHLFYNTLFDENASCHIAIGRAYRFTLEGGDALNDEEFTAAGGNVSLNHVDFMVGSPQMDIDGIAADGTREPVMRGGEWAF